MHTSAVRLQGTAALLELFSFCLSVCSVVVFVQIFLYVCLVCSFCVFVRILVYISPFCLSFHLLYVRSQYLYLRWFHALKCYLLICSCIVTFSLPMLCIVLHYSVFMSWYFFFFLSFFSPSTLFLVGCNADDLFSRVSFYLLKHTKEWLNERRNNIFVLL